MAKVRRIHRNPFVELYVFLPPFPVFFLTVFFVYFVRLRLFLRNKGSPVDGRRVELGVPTNVYRLTSVTIRKEHKMALTKVGRGEKGSLGL